MNDPAPPSRGKPTRDEKAAYRWVAEMIDDPERHGPGLVRWLARNPGRLTIYNRVAKSLNAATWDAARAPFPSRTRTRSAGWQPSRPARWLIAAAATASIVIGGYGLLHVRSPLQHPSQTALLVDEHAYATGIGEVRTIRLSDKSQVTLDTNSRIQLHFSSALRGITLLQGRARFDVSHDPARPFTVSAGDGSVTAIGTLFDVEMTDRVHVRLLRGAVNVSASGKPDPSGRIAIVLLAAGQQTSFALATPSARVAEAAVPTPIRASDEQWVTGMKAFDDVPLSEIVAEANRYSEVQIQIADADVAAQEAFVELDIRDVPDVAHKLAQLFHLELDQSEPGLIILRKPR